VHRTVRGLQHRNGVSWRFNPAVAVYTIKRSQYDLSPAFLLMAAAAISLVVVVGLRKTYKLALSSPTAVADAA
jgi:hypothetical protein